jgi:hypothetical protein
MANTRLGAENLGYPPLKIIDVCRERGVTPSAVSRWIGKGVLLADGSRVRLRATANPHGWRIDRHDLNAFLAAVTADRLTQAGAADEIRSPGEDEQLKKDLAAAGAI